MSDTALTAGDVVWASLDPVRGREQGGHRPCVVVSSDRYLSTATTLAMVAPITTVDRGWPNHIAAAGMTGLERPSWIMPEQTRTVSRDRITSVAGGVDPLCLHQVREWLRDFLDL